MLLSSILLQPGLRKPDPEIYKLACKRMGVAPSSVVYLDDIGVRARIATRVCRSCG